MRTIKTLALALVVMIALALTSSEAIAQQGAHTRLHATARVIKLVVPLAQLASLIAETLSDSTPNQRLLANGVRLTVIDLPVPGSTAAAPPATEGKAGDGATDKRPGKTVLIEYVAN